jgi:hypothetical protein
MSKKQINMVETVALWIGLTLAIFFAITSTG